ncbi:hypothetical protein Pmani_005444 [Petrolisthes manimaculis]|uniref:Uncharacterized protein n=1 Tax=Petrolisthes manimaculis TaxID=1843537 RepID=A0AAE1QCX5_9EUCA|nr:hypothetical protein Pmani_005444 [Petrolisthes manimaculis]
MLRSRLVFQDLCGMRPGQLDSLRTSKTTKTTILNMEEENMTKEETGGLKVAQGEREVIKERGLWMECSGGL